MIENNNQGELFDTITGEYEFGYLLKIFALCFVSVFIVSLVIISMVYLARKYLSSKRSSP